MNRPFDFFQAARQVQPEKSFGELCVDFACWEAARSYRDDPNVLAREAIAWIRQLDELAILLDDFPEDPARQACHAAIESAFEAFAKLPHDPLLTAAVKTWLEIRQAETASEA